MNEVEDTTSSQITDPYEVRNSELGSNIGSQYDSDSELLANDKLRLDDSDEDDEKPNDGNVSSTLKYGHSEKAEEKRDAIVNSESEDDNSEHSTKLKRKKITQLIDSESEEEQPDGNDKSANPTQKKVSPIMDGDSEVDDSAEERLQKQNQEINALGDQIEQSMNRLKTLVDSDSVTPDGEPDSDVKTRKKKKLKTKKERTNAKKNTNSNDLLASLNLDLSDEETRTNGSNDDDTGDENNASGNETKKKRKTSKEASEEKPQRMSAKTAMEQMKIIQSESQRMAREASVAVPYHRPKQHTLQEFLNRRTVFKYSLSPAGGMAEGRKKVAAAIKMNPEELAEYARKLEEREKEAKEFFKSESDEDEKGEIVVDPEGATETSVNPHSEITPEVVPESPMEIDTNLNKCEKESEEPKLCEKNTEFALSLRVSDTEEDPLDAMVNKTHDNIEQILASQPDDTDKQSSSLSCPIDYDIFSKPSKLAQKKAELLLDETIPIVPKLKGSPDSFIDLDCKQPKQSGAEILLKRFAKCAGKKINKSTNLTILSTDNGVLQMNTVPFALDPDDRDPNGKEPIPGAAFMKLKQTLRQKMEQTRRESLRQRQEEIKKLDENEDEVEQEEILDSDDEIEDEMEEEDQPEKNDDGKELLQDEAEEIDDGEDEAEQNIETEMNSSDSSSDEDVANEPPVDGVKKKSRILAAFDDSDEEINKNDEAADTVELLSGLGTQKLTQTDRNNQESEGGISLLWKDSTELTTATQADDDLLALCSGRFGSTQAAPEIEQDTVADSQQSDVALLTNKNKTPNHNTLFAQNNDHPTDENELLALCSGKFITQRETETEQNCEIQPDLLTKRKMIIASSDEEELENRERTRSKKKKWKRKNVNISDDEENPSETEEGENSDVTDDEEPEEPEAEHFVDYDSEENEIDVVMTKTDKQKVATTFLENEAELSESEWGSADEDEKDLDRYDIELGDEEKFDQGQLQQELERIHMRRLLEQDKKEVKTLQDMFFEDEEKDGVGRERQFRWRNVETTFALDYDKEPGEENGKGEDGSDGENEMKWRKMRHEREQVLKEKKVDLDAVNLSTTLLDKTMEEDENNSSVTNTSSLIARKRITVVRSKKCTEINTPKDSPFLITKSTVSQGYKASFLSRDSDTLNKLASMVKINPDTEGTTTVVAGKGRNFVFATVSPAVDKVGGGTKRSLDTDADDPMRSAKKARKATKHNKNRKILLLDQLI
ncbi:claspin [Toxorhynchites rutilus septentrionalis]|uniref:claspin n=1 Tax=Toxorhynchites rutilus septentrionalis TaxID=329112 RepID=UPI00247A4EAB|nr:claspin [Toxorhynchites rutilus septentrionalis]